jgi:hypothetical protein
MATLPRKSERRRHNNPAAPDATAVGKLVGVLPGALEQLPVIQRGAELLGESEVRALQWWRSRQGPVQQMRGRFARWSLRIEVTTRARSLLRRAKSSEPVRTLRALPRQVERRMDATLLRMGLIRLTVHRREVARLKAGRVRRRSSAAKR